MRIRVTIENGEKTLVLDQRTKSSVDLVAGVRVAIREFQRTYPGVPLEDVKVALETLSPGTAQMWL